ncbi:protein phosphatase 2C domain-containing protein [Streptomyces sp. NPDC053367]|uniref:protein phosphatase 2C domain-containing protein n=1 Tax=Streptomyces sp. NPDC053367 TaxID=3365700 RepID=UPI0037D3DEBF
MSQQGGRPTGPGPEEDWWRQLYDDSTHDTGPAPTPDSLDDRFASASGLTEAPGGAPTAPPHPAPPTPSVPPAPIPPPPDQPPPVPPAPRPGGDPQDMRPGPAPGASGPPAQDPPAGGPAGSARPVPPPRADADACAGPAGATREPDPLPGAGPRSAPAAPLAGDPHPAAGPPAQPPPLLPRAPWEPLPAGPAGPTTFPPGPRPPAGSTTATTGEAPAPDRPDPGDSGGSVLAQDRPRVPHVGSGPPTYEAEPTALPPADPDELAELVADTVLDGARCGSGTLRAVSVRGDSARYRGEPRRDSLLVARFGTGEQALVLVAMATGARATPGAHRAAAEVCRWIGRAVGRSHARLAEDIRGARRGDLKSGLHRLTDRSLGRLRASAVEQGVSPEEYAATLRCLLLPADPECRTRVFFGVGAGGLFRLRDGVWQDIEPKAGDVTGEPVVGFGSPPSQAPAETPEGDRLTMDLGIPTPPSPYEPAPQPPREPFRFRASVARPGDTLLLCTGGLAEPLRGEPDLTAYLTERWSGQEPPGLAAFLADAQVRVKGYADDRTAAAVWEA